MTGENMRASNVCSEEGEKTKRAREKLKRKFEELEKEITQEALKKKVIEIHDRISRHAPDRNSLARKSISLFDANQNPAAVSKTVNSFAQQIQVDNAIFINSLEKPRKSLKDYEISILG